MANGPPSSLLLPPLKCSLDIAGAPMGQCLKLSEHGALVYFPPFLLRAGQGLKLTISLPESVFGEPVKIFTLYEKYADGYPQVVQKILLVEFLFTSLRAESQKKIVQFLKSLELKQGA